MVGSFIGGFVAAEGCFTWNGDRLFMFEVALGATDAGMVELMHEFFGVGRVGFGRRRKAHYDDETYLHVRKTQDLVEVIVPFMDEHLPPSYKREQYEAWRAALLDHWEHRASRRRPCTVAGCDRPQKGRGVCRHHYFALYRE